MARNYTAAALMALVAFAAIAVGTHATACGDDLVAAGEDMGTSGCRRTRARARAPTHAHAQGGRMVGW